MNKLSYRYLFSIFEPIITYFLLNTLFIYVGHLFFDFHKDVISLISMSVVCLVLCWKLYQNQYVSVFKKLSFYKMILLIIMTLSMVLCITYLTNIFQCHEDVYPFSLISLLLIGFIGPINEEIVFRYFVLHRVHEKYNIAISIFVSSFLFAMMHQGFMQMTLSFFVGVILGIVMMRYKNIGAVILMHCCLNISPFIKGLSHLPTMIYSLAFVSLFCVFYILYKNQGFMEKGE